jgi:hypothetical protein
VLKISEYQYQALTMAFQRPLRDRLLAAATDSFEEGSGTNESKLVASVDRYIELLSERSQLTERDLATFVIALFAIEHDPAAHADLLEWIRMGGEATRLEEFMGRAL